MAEFQSYPKKGHLVIYRPVNLSVNERARGPHLEKPSAGWQMLLTVSEIRALIRKVTFAPDVTVEMKVSETKGIKLRSKDVSAQSQLEKTPIPQKPRVRFLPGLIKTIMLPEKPHLRSLYFRK